MKTVILLVLSSVFMTFAWYGHLKHLRDRPLMVAIRLCGGGPPTREGVMRWMAVVVTLVGLSLAAGAALADDEQKASTGERVLGGVISGLLGGPQQPPDAAYAAQERERLASLLQAGDYATSRQGETVDLFVLGIPLTRRDHVYSANPIPPSQVPAPRQSR